MPYIYLIPNLFSGLSFIFEFIFALITLIVARYSYKVYKLSFNNKSKLFALSFIFFSISYFIQSIFNLIIISALDQTIIDLIKIQAIPALNMLGIYSHMFFFTIGLVTLAYMTLNIKNPQAYKLILLISIFSIIISQNKIYWFYFLSSLLLIFIIDYYATSYIKNKQKKVLLVLISFMFLLFGHIHFIFLVNHALFYAIGHFFELIAYILILTKLLLILKNGKEKR